jgi:hypothetical protein
MELYSFVFPHLFAVLRISAKNTAHTGKITPFELYSLYGGLSIRAKEKHMPKIGQKGLGA